MDEMLTIIYFSLAISLIGQLQARDEYKVYPHVIIEPEIVFTDNEGHRLILKYQALGRKYEHRLILNQYLFSPEYREQIVEEYRSSTDIDCYYQDDPQYDTGSAALGICNGQVNGIVAGNEIHFDDETGLHNFYGQIPTTPTANREPVMAAGAFDVDRLTAASDGRFLETPVVELLFVYDHAVFTKYFQHDKEKLLDFDRQLIASINSVYLTSGVHVVSAGSLMWDERELLGPSRPGPVNGRYTDEIEVHLDRFSKLADKYYYRKIPYDVVILIMGHTYPASGGYGFTTGIANYAQVCRSKATGVIQYSQDGHYPRTLRQLVNTITHEMGHILGKAHVKVNDDGCPCSGPKGRCIMNPTAADTHVWTGCTVNTFANVAHSNQGWCLHAHTAYTPEMPKTTTAKPTPKTTYWNTWPPTFVTRRTTTVTTRRPTTSRKSSSIWTTKKIVPTTSETTNMATVKPTAKPIAMPTIKVTSGPPSSPTRRKPETAMSLITAPMQLESTKETKSSGNTLIQNNLSLILIVSAIIKLVL
ncbi:Zinc metalloproteinase/disintegrin [Halotydeus destructor]|nr:Zinc metalloproteinase/disintegrin [Halotydeus destructor]